MSKYYGLIVCFLFFTSMTWAKQQCQPYLDKLRQVQALQRQGHSNQQARRLASREQKARDKWWQCKQGKLTPKSVKKTKKAKKSLKMKRRHYPIKAKAITSYTNKVVIKGAFSGQKQQDWLDFYQPLAKCRHPRTTQVFAFCMEDRQRQQAVFDKQYQP